jgi:iron complex transport system ATP-binding protein
MTTIDCLPAAGVLCPTAFPGTRLIVTPERLTLHGDRPLRCLASTIVGGGLGTVRSFLSLNVARNFDCTAPAALLRREAASQGIQGRFVGFLTAVPLDRAAVVDSEEPRLLVVVTAGSTNAATPGRSPVAAARPGTINIIALLDANLPPASLVAAVKVVTEAKTLALLEAGIRTPEGGIATGTSTDAVAIACTGEGPRVPYVGPVTATGAALGRLVTEAVRCSLDGGNVRPAVQGNRSG